MRIQTIATRLLPACSLWCFTLVRAQMPTVTAGEKMKSEYNKLCGSKDKDQMETAVSVTDANKRTNSCMCGFLQASHELRTIDSLGGSVIPCVNGFAGIYPCSNVDLLSYMSVPDVNIDVELDTVIVNDLWGWTDSDTGREYALVGTSSGTSFIDITSPSSPIHLGKLRSHLGGTSLWRDLKTYDNHVFIVSEFGEHGMQVFDLTQLRGLHTSPDLPIFFNESAHYNGFGNSHNIAINEEEGYAYAVGTNTCEGGLHMIDILDPVSPQFAGCFAEDGYTHDVQCVIYQGNDAQFVGREICFASNTNQVTIVDVTEKSNPVLLSRFFYANSNETFTHQGWLTPNHNYFLFGDETDELILTIPTTTFVLNVMDLSNPSLAGIHTASTDAIDHNQYTKDNLVYQTNYRAGLRILNMTDISVGQLQEVGYFDIYPDDDDARFNGAWSNYPYFASGNIIVSGVEQGLFVVRQTNGASASTPVPTPPPTLAPTPSPTLSPTPAPSPNPIPAPRSVCGFFTQYPVICDLVGSCQWDLSANACVAKP